MSYKSVQPSCVNWRLLSPESMFTNLSFRYYTLCPRLMFTNKIISETNYSCHLALRVYVTHDIVNTKIKKGELNFFLNINKTFHVIVNIAINFILIFMTFFRWISFLKTNWKFKKSNNVENERFKYIQLFDILNN